MAKVEIHVKSDRSTQLIVDGKDVSGNCTGYVIRQEAAKQGTFEITHTYPIETLNLDGIEASVGLFL